MNYTLDEVKDLLKKNPALKCRDLAKLNDIPQVEKITKFHNKPEWFDGHFFPSQAEKNRYCELKLLKAAGVIKDFTCQPKFQLTAGLSYKPDFEIEYWDHIEYEEVKGFFTESSKIRIKLFKEKYPTLILKVIINGEVVKCF